MNFGFYLITYSVTNLDEVLIPGKHLYFLVSGDELQVLFNPFFTVTRLDEVSNTGQPTFRFPVMSFLI